MDQRILFETSPWFILICLLTGLVYAILLYRQKNPWSKKQSILLASLRFIVVAAIAFLLLGPLIRYIRNTIIDPALVVVIDNSRSIQETYGENDFSDIREQLELMVRNMSELDTEIRVKNLNGEDIGSVQELPFEVQSTDLDQVLQEIENEYESRNLGGVVLISDGIYNQGASPVYSNFSFPVYSLGIGDTTEKEDVVLRSLSYNKIVYQGNRFIIRAEIYNKGYAGMPVTVRLQKGNTTLDRRIITLEEGNGFQSVDFDIVAEESGMQRYIVILDPLSSEFTIENNALNAYVEVVEGKEKILIMAPSPHPDIKALKSIIERNDNYEVALMIPEIESSNDGQYDLVILHQLPDYRNTYQDDISEFMARETPVFFILGAKTNLTAFNTINQTLEVKSLRNQRDNVFTTLNNGFMIFDIEDETKEILSELPPLTVPFGEYSVAGESETILYQRVGRISTEKPLLVLNNNQIKKEAVMAGEGLWKWRLNEYLLSERFSGIDDLINKIIQYLSAKEDRRRFRVYPLRNENWDNEPVIFENEIYNDIYERIYDQKIDLSIQDESGETFEYSYVISRANSQFRVSGLLPGVYSYVAKTNLNGSPLVSEGMFSVNKQVIEVSNLKADFNMLRELSRRSSGKFYTLGDINQLIGDLSDKPFRSLIYSDESYVAVINLKWIFFLLLILITLEWAVRKYLGGY